MKSKLVMLGFLIVGVLMVSIYWLTGTTAIGVIGYSILSAWFLIAFVTTIKPRK